MESENFKSIIKQRSFILIIIWFAMCNAILVLVGIVFFLKPSQSINITGSMQKIFPIIALIVGFSSFFLNKFFLSDQNIKKALDKDFNLNNIVDATEREKIKSLKEFEQKKLNLIILIFLPTIISLALNESIAIFGFLLAISKQEPQIIIPYALAALALNIIVFPKVKNLMHRADRLNRSF